MLLDELVTDALSGNRRAISRLATIIESQSEQASEVRKAVQGRTGNAQIVGITGPPGAGKSSVLSNLAGHLSSAGKSVAIIAIDPTSPVSGGATLGDRIRMSEVSLRSNVFVRSLASRSNVDGLAPAAIEMTRLFDAAGFDYVFLETVGAGQNQVEIASYVQTLVLVEAPGAGDSVQMLKAGIMELAHIYVVNKSDLPGAGIVSRELRAMLSLNEHEAGQWQPRIVLCSSKTGEGFEALVQSIDAHRAYHAQADPNREQNLRFARAETLAALVKLAEQALAGDDELLAAVASGMRSPEQAAGLLLSRISPNPRVEI